MSGASAIKTVALAGATGNLGPAILSALSTRFAVTVLTRQTSKNTFPDSITVKPVDYESVSSLTAALEGIDAVVSTLATSATIPQTNLIDASLAAGVKRFIPSEYGSDTSNPKNAALPVFAGKVSTEKYLKEKCTSESGLTYTFVITGPFLDWGLKVGFVLGTTTVDDTTEWELFNGGDVPFPATTLSQIGKAVAGVLTHPAETANRFVFVRNAVITQNQLLKIAEKISEGTDKKWPTKNVDVAGLEKSAYEELGKEKPNFGAAMRNFIKVSIWGKGTGGFPEGVKLDNELLGIEEFGDKEIEELVGKYVK